MNPATPIWEILLYILPLSLVICYIAFPSYRGYTPAPKKRKSMRKKLSGKEIAASQKAAADRRKRKAQQEEEAYKREESKFYRSLVERYNKRGIFNVPGVPDKYLYTPRTDGHLPLDRGSHKPGTGQKRRKLKR